MNTKLNRIGVAIVLQLVLSILAANVAFATEPIFTQVPTSISGRVWLENSTAPQQAPAVHVPVFVQRIDQAAGDMVTTLVVYTDNIGGFALEGLDPGTYQIWTESDADSLFLQIVTIDENTPTATADLMFAGYQVYMPTVMR